MDRQFFIKDYKFSADKTKLETITGYFTDGDHTIITPTLVITRHQAISLLNSHDKMFLFDGCYRRIDLKLVLLDNQEYLRVDCFSAPFDYLV